MNFPSLTTFFHARRRSGWLGVSLLACALVVGLGSLVSRWNVLNWASAVPSAVQAATSSVVTVNAASYVPRLAPGAIAAVFGTRLTEQTQLAATVPLPRELSGLVVRLVDSHGSSFDAALFFVSPGQINYLIPEQIALGEAQLTVLEQNSLVARGNLFITNSAPALFTVTANGKGVPTALTTLDGNTFAAVAESDGRLRPLVAGSSKQPNYLLLFGTGLRFAEHVRVRVGTVEIKPVYVGAQGLLAGLDQINLALPPELPGGVVNLQIISDGYVSNSVQLELAGF